MSAIQGLLNFLKAADGISDNIVRAIEPVLTSPAFDNAFTDAIRNTDLSNLDEVLEKIQRNASSAEGLSRQAQEFLTGTAFKRTLEIQVHGTRFLDEGNSILAQGKNVDFDALRTKYYAIPDSVFDSLKHSVELRETTILGYADGLVQKYPNASTDELNDYARDLWVWGQQKQLLGDEFKEAMPAIPTSVADNTAGAGRNADNVDAPTPEPTPTSGASTADEGASVADDANEFPRDVNGNPSRATADAADDLGAGHAATPSRSKLASAAQWTWDNTAGRVFNPVGRFISDSWDATLALPNYIKRAASWRFSDHQYTKGLFARMDTYKTTNTARLSTLINADNAIAGNAGNYLYKAEKSTQAADNLTGAMSNVETTLRNTSASISSEVDTMAHTLEDASTALSDAAHQIEAARAAETSVDELRQAANTFEYQSKTYVGGTLNKIPLDEMSEQLALHIRSTTDEQTLTALTTAHDAVTVLKNSSLTEAEIAAQASKIYGNLALTFSSQADEATQAVAKMTAAANDTIRNQMSIIEGMGNSSDSIFTDLTAAAERLSNDVTRINNSLTDMAAAAPSNPGDRLVGGTIVARLAAHEATPYMDQISAFSNNVSSLSNDLQSSISLATLESKLGNVLQASDGNKVDNLMQLSEDLAQRAETLRSGAVEQLDNVLDNYASVETALHDMDNAVKQYTSETADINGGLFSKNAGDGTANTNLMTEQDVGRIEAEITSTHKRRFRALVNNGDLHVNYGEGQTLDDVIAYKPGEDAFNITSNNGNAAHIQRTDDQKFMEYAFVFRDAREGADGAIVINETNALKHALTAAESMLNAGDENRYWEAMKWSMLSYSRNATTGGITGAERTKIFDQFLDNMRNRGKGLGVADAREGPFSDRVIHATADAISGLASVGANSYRKSWVDTWNRTRNIRFSQDFANEMTDGTAFERGLAQKWDTGFGPTGRVGMESSILRISQVAPKALWDNLPYRKTHFGTPKAAALTSLKIAGTVGTVWWLGATTKHYMFGDDNENQNNDEASRDAAGNIIPGLAISLHTAEDLDDARDLSEKNLELVGEKIEEINGLYDDLSQNMRTIFDDNIKKIDSYIIIQESLNTDEGREQADKYRELKTQVQTTFNEYGDQLLTDQAQLGTGAEISRLAIMRLDGLIQGPPDLHVDVANELLKQQNDFINALQTHSDMALKNGLIDVNSMVGLFDAAIINGEPLETLPTPSQLSTLTPEEIIAEEARIAADAKAVDDARIAADVIAATLALQNAEDVNTAAQTALAADPDNADLQAAAVKAQADFDLLNVEEIARLKAAEDARIAADAKAVADAKTAETARLAGLTPEQRTAEAEAVVVAARAADPLYDQHRDAKSALAEATSASNRVAKLYGSDTTTNSAAFLVAGMKTEQADKIVRLSEDMFDKGDHNAVTNLNELLTNVNGNNRAAEDILTRMAGNQVTAKALQEQIDALNIQIQAITTPANMQDADDLLTTLQGKTSALKEIKTDSEALHKEIEQLVTNNAALIQNDPDAKYHFGTGSVFTRGAIAAGGGEYGLLNQFLGSEAGGTSVIGGYFNMATSKLRDGMDWWSEAKRGARTQGERNGYNLAEQGFLAFMSIVALNKVGEWTGMSKGVKIAMLVGIIGYFIHRSGATGQDMRDHAEARNPFAQINPSIQGRNNLPRNIQSNVVPIRRTDGSQTTHTLTSANQTDITAQGGNGGVPQNNVVDIRTASAAKDDANQTTSVGQGNGSNIVNFGNRADAMKLVANGETPAGADNLITFPDKDNEATSLEAQSMAS